MTAVAVLWLLYLGGPSPYRRYSLDYVDEEEAAQDARAGLWKGEFVPPWEWRRGQRLQAATVPENATGCSIKGNISSSGARRCWCGRSHQDQPAEGRAVVLYRGRGDCGGMAKVKAVTSEIDVYRYGKLLIDQRCDAAAKPGYPERVGRQPFMMRRNGACAQRSQDHPQPEERVIEPAQLDDRVRPSPRFPPGKGRGSCSWAGVASPRR